MVRREVQVLNKKGVHARPAAVIVEMTGRYRSEVFLIKDGIRANAKSIMNILLLAIEPGSTVLLEAEGPDEDAALKELADLLENRIQDENFQE